MHLLKNISFYALIVASLFIAVPEAQSLTLGYRGGLSHSNQPSHGAVAALYLGPKLSIAFSYNYAGVSVAGKVEGSDSIDNLFTASTVDVKKAYIKRIFQEGQLRYHPRGGSFFLAVGGIVGSGEGHLIVQETSGSGQLERKYKYQSQLLSLNIGNVWDKTGMLIGFEWVGLTRNASYKYETTSTTSETQGTYITGAEDSFLNKMKTVGGAGGFTTLMLHVGFSI
jgi:hypothetical protein